MPAADLAGYYAAGDVFAMPCRTRGGGLDVEGLGIVFLEASAAGLPVVVGDSGGAPETVRRGVTGEVVDGRDAAAVADACRTLLTDRVRARRYGAAGRRWVADALDLDRVRRPVGPAASAERPDGAAPGMSAVSLPVVVEYSRGGIVI